MERTVCAFGYFDLEGERSWVIRKGLEEVGFSLTLCRTEAKGFWPKIRDLLKQWKTLQDSPAPAQEPKLTTTNITNKNQQNEITARRQAPLAWSATSEGRVGSWEGNRRFPSHAIDVLYVVFPGHYMMPLAWHLARKWKIPIIFDAFLSLYETEVEDRRRLSPWHPKAWFLFFIDWLACALADVILVDTEEHRQYLICRYHVPPGKILVIPVGCRTDLFSPQETQRPQSPFRVRFHGSFIPLHGIETILRAAGELKEENILFELAGRGQLSQSSEKLANNLTLSNVRFVGHVPLTEIPRFIAGADVCLGIFALTPKAQRVIPTKVYEILACGRPLITAHTPAISRVFRDREHALLVTPGDSQDLAAKILELKADPSLAETIAHNGYTLFAEKFQPRMVVEPLVEWLRGENHPPTLYSSHFP